MSKRQSKYNIALGYAYEFRDIANRERWVLCSWAEPDKERLERGPKPSPEARMVKVAIIRTKDLWAKP